ncbi:MAG: hypothetical protein ACPGTU_16295 [Myxococcota bacterium]
MGTDLKRGRDGTRGGTWQPVVPTVSVGRVVVADTLLPPEVFEASP